MGYTDYDRYAQLTAQKIFFVTRQKRNARYEVLERRKVNKKQGLLSDQTIRLQAQECPIPLRRIAYRDAATGRRYVFLTNHFKLAAKTIADIYKERWQICRDDPHIETGPLRSTKVPEPDWRGSRKR